MDLMGEMRTSPRGQAFIKGYEKCRLKAYKPTPNDRWTVGWGHTGPDVYEGLVIAQAQADALFVKDLKYFEDGVNRLVKINVTQCEYDALVSFAYNVGLGGLEDSTLLRKLNAKDIDGASAEFPKWNKQGGVVMPGLTKRRLDERRIFDGKD